MFDKVPPRNRHRPSARYLNRLGRTNRQLFPSATILRILSSADSTALSETTTEGKTSHTFLTGFGRSSIMAILDE